jgi:biopolymer transport protein ExbB
MLASLAMLAAEVPAGFFDSAFRLFDQGGPVMWPILAVSLVGVSVAIERLFAFWKYNAANVYFSKTQKKVLALTREGKWDEAVAAADKGDSPICRVMGEALKYRDVGFIETLESASQLEITRLGRGMSVLDTTITVAPMLGILGTVTGIINTFAHLNAAGIENPGAATAGISEALITTAAGLIVAISCLFPFNFLVSQIKRRTLELEQVTHQMELAYNTGRAK